MRRYALCLFLLGFSLPAHAQMMSQKPATMTPQQTSPPTGKASVEGNVLNSISREPIKNATVRLNGPWGGLTASTDAAGHFAFRELAAGPYLLDAVSGGYSPPRVRGTRIILGQDEKKSAVSIELAPLGSISGKVVDEEGEPKAQCAVMASARNYPHAGPSLRVAGSGTTDLNGEYRLRDLQPGKYYVNVQCRSQIQLPHPFIRPSGDGENVPTMTYGSQFYPDSQDINGATRITVSPGSDFPGVDFKVAAIPNITVRVQVSGPDFDPAKNRGLRSMLVPRDGSEQPWNMNSGTVDRTGVLRFRSVSPGSYDVVVTTVGQEPFFGRAAVEVGTSDPKPVDLVLSPSLSVSGSIEAEFESQTNASFENIHLGLEPLEGYRYNLGAPAQVQIKKDGTFQMTGVLPLRWKVNLWGPIGYVKSISVQGHEVPGSVLDLSSGAAGQVKIVFSDKQGEVDGTVSGLPDSAAQGQVEAVLLPAEASSGNRGSNMMVAVQGGNFTLKVNPGTYRACALDNSSTELMWRDPSTMATLMDQCTTLKVTAGEKTSAEIRYISPEDLTKLSDAAQ